ncbi:MAG: 1-(5-phosphoribosyl)-5-amino-4-imidazole-carboxylate carboxylase [Planctomycetes bacterium]|nr:1-(5-phosphoribosyl)-5-amino-4-imidazole-carboxylate carboxylase [Planctomycetota bacterium]
MNTQELKRVFEAVREGTLAVSEGIERLTGRGELDLGHTRLDIGRAMRCGHPEVIYGEGKTPEQVLEIARAVLTAHDSLLVTRTSEETAALLTAELAGARHHALARAVTVEPDELNETGSVIVVCAGTSDLPVAEEAALTARMLGARVQTLPDVGVAGLHRLLAHVDRLRKARAVVVVAGMEGALPSVVGGLVDRPVIAVPTSIGYGASFGGIAALLAMLNSCAAGVSVVNIDNGFGAGYQAAQINRMAEVTTA